jgi:hypothetical protein
MQIMAQAMDTRPQESASSVGAKGKSAAMRPEAIPTADSRFADEANRPGSKRIALRLSWKKDCRESQAIPQK